MSANLQLYMSQEEQEGLAASLSALKPKPAKKWNIPPLQTKVLLDPHNLIIHLQTKVLFDPHNFNIHLQTKVLLDPYNLNIHLQTKVLNPRNLKVLNCHSNKSSGVL